MPEFELGYNVTGSERKRLVTAITEITECAAKYKGAPTFAYEVDYFTITKTGSVVFDDRADSEEIENLVEKLKEKGFEPEYGDTYMEQPDIDEPEPVEDTPLAYGVPEQTGLTISIPFDKVSVGNLTALLDAKGALIQKALGIPATPIEMHEDCVSFPWFETMPAADEVRAYSDFICKLCAMTRNQKRITAKEKEIDNEKYAFRCFLLRLGFIGEEYKAERKILLRNLSGSSAFKGGNPKVRELVERIEADAGLYDDVMSLQDEEVESDEVSE
jgi:hypothetical protein